MEAGTLQNQEHGGVRHGKGSGHNRPQKMVNEAVATALVLPSGCVGRETA
jgi:hypothetical protein